MKIKTRELIGPALDWAVAICEGYQRHAAPSHVILGYSPSTDWAHGGPIIERECICTYASGACYVAPKNPDYWVAEILETDGMRTEYGPTPPVAAMRCYVASKLGDEVEVPEELTK